MRQRCVVFFLVGSLLLLGQRASALEFTADQVTKIDGKRAQKSYIYYRDNMWRIEHHTIGTGQCQHRAEGQTDRVAAAVADETFQDHAVQSLSKICKCQRAAGRRSFTSKRSVRNTREGHPTTLYEVIVEARGNGRKSYYQWLATDIHFPMKLGQERRQLDRRVSACEITLRDRTICSTCLLNFEPLEEIRSAPTAPGAAIDP